MSERQRLLQIALRRDLSGFTRKCFGTLLPGDRFRPNWHLDAIAYKLEEVIAGKIKRLLITVPPRSAKSLLASVACPAFLLGRDPTARVVCASYAQPLAVTFSNQCRTIMGSTRYRDAFAGTVLSPRKNTEAEFQTTRHGGRLATSVGGVLTGRGGDVIIIDDPLKPTDAMSEAIRTDTNSWFDQTVLSRLDDKTEGAIVLVMQRLHVDDLAGHLLERGGWDYLNLPAIAEIDELVPIARGKVHARRIVHAKAMLVDDAWGTVGSCNLHANSLSGHTEMNASVWDGSFVSALRRDLLWEHLDEDTSHLDDRAALRRYGQIARANALRRRTEDPDWQGLALALDPAAYGRETIHFG